MNTEEFADGGFLSLDEIEGLAALTPQGWTWEESRRLLAAARQALAMRAENARLAKQYDDLADACGSA